MTNAGNSEVISPVFTSFGAQPVVLDTVGYFFITVVVFSL
jgi:hypothetical protein